MEDKTQSKKWNITIDNIDKHGITHDVIKESLKKCNIKYYCMADEITASGMKHTHLYIELENNIRFSTLKRRLPKVAHIETAKGTAQENKDYVLKQGKYAGTEKAETSIEGTFEEEGTIEEPKESTNNSKKKEQLIALVEQGLSNYEIIKIMPEYCFKIKDIEQIRQTMLTRKYQTELRNTIEVNYLYGETGTGKTRSIYDNYDITDIARITNYGNINGIKFDVYSHQKVLVFEEFNNQIPIEEMLNYLDIYPLQLPARYYDRTACYDTVFITSNLPFEHQYEMVKYSNPRQYDAWCRRITNIIRFDAPGKIEIEKGVNIYEHK